MNAYDVALARYATVGASHADDQALMAGFCKNDLSFLVGAVSPKLVWLGAQSKGMTTRDLAVMASGDIMAVSDLQWL